MMEGATERRIVYGLCLVAVVIALIVLIEGLNRSDTQLIGVSFFLIVLTVATGIAFWRSGRVQSETDEE
jgi:hypothetical protein